MPHIAAVLYQSLRLVQSLNLPAGTPSSGKQFEDYVVVQLYQELKHQDGYRVFPPRHTLRADSFSGVSHQFDILVDWQDELYAVECKFRGNAHIDQLFATEGKLCDYRQRPKGIFVTTAVDVNAEIYYYALAHHIQLISHRLPPVEYLLQKASKGTGLAHILELLRERLEAGEAPPKHLLVEWKNAYQRFQAEGYCE